MIFFEGTLIVFIQDQVVFEKKIYRSSLAIAISIFITIIAIIIMMIINRSCLASSWQGLPSGKVLSSQARWARWPGGLVGQVVRWPGGQVARWSGGQVVQNQDHPETWNAKLHQKSLSSTGKNISALEPDWIGVSRLTCRSTIFQEIRWSFSNRCAHWSSNCIRMGGFSLKLPPSKWKQKPVLKKWPSIPAILGPIEN